MSAWARALMLLPNIIKPSGRPKSWCALRAKLDDLSPIAHLR
jgi:hypothetical protein